MGWGKCIPQYPSPGRRCSMLQAPRASVSPVRMLFLLRTQLPRREGRAVKKNIDMGASAKDPPLKLTSMLIGISLIKILVFYIYIALQLDSN